ncbi:MAG: group III truncated hemoglobin [Cyclobacteriaceae bacterium]|nr:group III truncated hemoglobin [Cyclobacteriaceae bacterium]
MKDITSRQDIAALMQKFYINVLANQEIGKFFSESVKNWDHHLARFTDYWESNVLFSESYEGSPLKRHIEIDRRYDHSFVPGHFDLWVELFERTTDEMFAGEKAELAKEVARNMSRNIHNQMFIGRKPEKHTFNH